MGYEVIREQVYETVLHAKAAGLIRLSAGNISARTADGFVAITPSGIKYDVLRPGEIAIVDLEGRSVEAPKKPSSETPMHTAIYRGLPEVGAICHTHSPVAITFSMLGIDIPMTNLELMVCGAPIPVAPWACPGSSEAGEVTVRIFQSRPDLRICLLRNHGLVAIGKHLENSFELAFDAEIGMQTYYQALLIGQPLPLTQQQLDQIHMVYG